MVDMALLSRTVVSLGRPFEDGELIGKTTPAGRSTTQTAAKHRGAGHTLVPKPDEVLQGRRPAFVILDGMLLLIDRIAAEGGGA
ncbi:MAG: hypothetical protein WCD21_22860 [Streptomyces sp.]